MNTTIDLFCGAPVEIESERSFLANLCEDFQKMGIPTLVFANFIPLKNQHQIDFLIVTGNCACHVELKHLVGPVKGNLNGPWLVGQPNGDYISMQPGKNPFWQARDGTFAISDQMHCFARTSKSVPICNTKYYKHLESVVCVFPSLHPDSVVHQHNHVQVMGYRDLLSVLSKSKVNPGWDRQQWIQFAMHMGLVRSETSNDQTNLDMSIARQAISDYRQRFVEYQSKDLPRLVPTRANDGAILHTTDQLLDRVKDGKHIQLVGPSGCGKTLLARHMAMTAAQGGLIPIFVPAKEYEGKLSSLLDRSVAHLHPDTALHLADLAVKTGTQMVLILDGLNECAKTRQKSLLKDLQAFCLRWKVPVLFSAQEPVSVTHPLSGTIFRFQPISNEERLAVFGSYLDKRELPPDAAALLIPFTTPYELYLAAECLGQLGSDTTRSALFETYVRRRCENTYDPEVTHAILCAIADRMQRQFANSLSLVDARRAAQSVVKKEGGRMRSLSDALDSGLLDVRQGRCSFRHEMLANFLQSEVLVQRYSDSSELAKNLARPRNRSLAEFVVGTETDEDAIRLCLETLADATMLAKCLAGHWGARAKEIVYSDCSRILLKAEKSLDAIQVSLTNRGDGHYEDLIVTGMPNLSSYEIELLQTIGQVLATGQFIAEYLKLVRRTEEVCYGTLLGKENDRAVNRPGIKSYLTANLYVFMSQKPTLMPVSLIYHAFYNHSGFARCKLDIQLLSPWIGRLSELLPGELLFLCSVLRRLDERHTDGLIDLLRQCWRSGAYHLRLHALHLAESYAAALEGTIRDEMTQFLSSLESRNWALSSTIVETCSAYGLIEAPVSEETVRQDLTTLLQQPDDPESQICAYHMVANIFEDVYQGVFFEVIESLSPDQRSRLLTMAALGVSELGSMFIDWILMELLKLDCREVLPAFLRWSSFIDVTGLSRQEATVCYIYAVMGCAKYLDTPPLLTAHTGEEARAWEAYGAIFFWTSKPGLTNEAKGITCAPYWEMLHANLAFEAVDPLLHFMSAQSFERFHAFKELCSSFPDNVRRVLEFGLQQFERLTSIFDQSHSTKEDRLLLIQALGAVGDHGTVRLLEGLTESPEFGRYAIEAIHRINERAGLWSRL